MKLNVDFCGVPFFNPFLLAASPCSDSKEMIARAFEAGWAGAVLKTTSVEEDEIKIAYPIMTSFGTGSAATGLFNIDLISKRRADVVLEDVRWLKERFPEHRVVASIVGKTRNEWASLAERFSQAGSDLLEVGISCPQGTDLENVDSSATLISHDPRLTEIVTSWVVEEASGTPVSVKLSSGVTDITAIAEGVMRGGAQGFCLMDSLESVPGADLEAFQPRISIEGRISRGGYTGQAIKPITLNTLTKVAAMPRTLPVSGVGGITDWKDALDFILYGATTLQVCTAAMRKGFSLIDELTDGLSRWMTEKGISSPEEIRGRLLPSLTENDNLARRDGITAFIDDGKCIGCGRCYVACRDGGHQAISFDAKKRLAAVIPEKCVGCGFCRGVCPLENVISLKYEDRG